MTLTTIHGTNHGAKTLVRVRPRGFCAGVVRAVDIVELALEAYGNPVYVHHEIVHNRYVVDQLRRRGAIFVETIEEVPVGSVLVFSAHGVPPRVRVEAQSRELRVVDATCPLVTKVHLEALKFAREGRTLILIGHRDHQEIVGTSGEAPDRTIIVGNVEEVDQLVVPDPTRLAFLTQTTLSLYDTQEIVARLRQRFPAIVGPASDDICYATQNRQEAVEALTHEVELILVVGSANSSNSNRLVEVAIRAGVASRLIEDANDIDASWLDGVKTLGLTAGASVFVYPSLYEGFGFPVAQAMAAGVPVVTSNLSSLPEITGGAASLIDPLSVGELRGALDRLLTSPAERQGRSEAGREQAQRFRWDECARQSVKFFEEVAG